jgi:ribosomal protein S21
MARYDFGRVSSAQRSFVKDGSTVFVRDNNVDQALKKLKRQTANSGVMRKFKEKQAFVSNGEKVRAAAKQAEKRRHKSGINALASDLGIPKVEAKALYFGRKPR